MQDLNRGRILDGIRGNIREQGRHVYLIGGGPSPRFAYTIGLSEKVGCELVFPGGALLTDAQVGRLLNTVAADLEMGAAPVSYRKSVEGIGAVRLLPADQSWVKRLLLGALDYYEIETLPAWQVLPEEDEKRSIDIPDTTRPYDPQAHPIWRWLEMDWPYAISKTSIARTDLDLLLGFAASEVMRWEETEWEIYSGERPDSIEQAYTVPLATILAFYADLASAVNLPVGRGMIREFTPEGTAGPWLDWGTEPDESPTP